MQSPLARAATCCLPCCADPTTTNLHIHGIYAWTGIPDATGDSLSKYHGEPPRLVYALPPLSPPPFPLAPCLFARVGWGRGSPLCRMCQVLC